MNSPRRAGDPPGEHRPAAGESFASHARAAFGGARRRLSGVPAIELLTVLLLAGGMLLVMADFLHLYEVRRGVVVVEERAGGDHHSYAMLVIGLAVIVGALTTRATGAWPPAAALTTLGLAALAIVLLGDLPDATSSGLTVERRLGEAEPGAGFWVELAGALVAVGGGAAVTFLLHRER